MTDIQPGTVTTFVTFGPAACARIKAAHDDIVARKPELLAYEWKIFRDPEYRAVIEAEHNLVINRTARK